MAGIQKENPYHWTNNHYRNQQHHHRYSYQKQQQQLANKPQNIYCRPSSVPTTPYPSPASSGSSNGQKNRANTQQIQRQAPEALEDNTLEIIRPLFLKKGIDISQSVKLGRGRYSTVITAKQLRQGDTTTVIAMKIINTAKVQGDFVQKFLPREIDCWRRLDHPYLVKVLGHYECRGHVFLTMEYGERGDLLRFLQKNGPLAESLTREWMLQMLHSVGYMHELGIAHRDLKLENVVLCRDYSIKVTDFGFARICDQDTLSRTFCGSKSYSAPEILLGQPYCPFMSDVWSLGVIAYTMVTNQLPFSDKMNNQKITTSQRNRDYDYPPKLGLSERCTQSIDQMLTYEVEKRPQLTECLRLSYFTFSPKGAQ